MNDEEQVGTLDEAWNEAYRRRDIGALERTLAADWLGLTPTHEVVTRAQLIEGQRQAAARAEITFQRGAVYVFGDTAVSTGSTKVSAPDVSIEQRFTRIWAKRDGHWQAVAVQLVPLSGVA